MEKGIIVTSFGTSNRRALKASIESIEIIIKEKYRDYLVTRAFTSRMVINILKKRDDYHVDTPSEALEKMKEAGIREIFIQPLLIIEGHEYQKILDEVDGFKRENPEINVQVGRGLLVSQDDYERVIDGLDLSKENAQVLVGHGSDHESDISYGKLQEKIWEKGYGNTYLGTIEGSISLDQVIENLKGQNIDRLILRPFMLVAGVHALDDIGSDEEDSWKSILENKGIHVELDLRGLGEIVSFQDIFVDHLERIIGE